jgi:hypothetical protein
MTFDKYNLLLLYDNNHYIYIYIYILKCVQMFHHKFKGKGRKGNNSSSSQVRSDMSTDLFVITILLNFYLYVLIHYYFTVSFDIFYRCFCLQGISATRHCQKAFLETLNDEG